MRISVCVGEYAQTPYLVPGLELRVYCLEELCYCIRENAFLIDTSLMNDGLVNWLGRECGLSELAGELSAMVHKRGSLSAFVTRLMEYAGLYDSRTVGEMEQVLKKGAGLSAIEKRKSQVDCLTEKKRYAAAVKGYEGLLASWKELSEEGKELPAVKVLAGILHNQGAAYVGLMLYGRASECFLEAYRTSENEEELFSYLAAKRMELSQEEYISFAAGLKGSGKEVLRLEKELERIERGFQEEPEFLRLQERKQLKEENGKRYREDSIHLLEALKNNYINSTGE